MFQIFGISSDIPKYFFVFPRSDLHKNWSGGTLDHPKHAPTEISILVYLHLYHYGTRSLICTRKSFGRHYLAVIYWENDSISPYLDVRWHVACVLVTWRGVPSVRIEVSVPLGLLMGTVPSPTTRSSWLTIVLMHAGWCAPEQRNKVRLGDVAW